MRLTPTIINSLIMGSTFLGTGGGGSPKEARKLFASLYRKKTRVTLQPVNAFRPDDLFITAFGVGSISNTTDPTRPIQQGSAHLTKLLGEKIAGVIPVEIGPLSLATAWYIAFLLDVPIVDADMVGGRSTPEVFLETITLFNLPRTPAVIINNEREAAVLLATNTPEQQEKFFRDFAVMSGGQAYVIGYPLTKKQITKTIEHGTVTDAITIGQLLNTNQYQTLKEKKRLQELFVGRISAIKKRPGNGFSEMMVEVQNKKDTAKIYIKNENLVCWVNKKVVLTCPDLIILLDQNRQPIYNANLKQGQRVQILGMAARKLWRTKKGLRLFNPKTFGFLLPPTLLP